MGKKRNNSNRSRSRNGNKRGNGSSSTSPNTSPETSTNSSESTGDTSSSSESKFGSRTLVSDFGSIIFTNPAGMPLDLSGGITPTGTSVFKDAVINNLRNFQLPGIMSFDVLTGPGESYDGVSAVNIASRKMYTIMRNLKSGTFPFEHQDVTMFVIAMDNMSMLYQHVVRAYRTLLKYDGLNRYTPKALLMAMGFNYEDLSSNIKKLKGLIDLFVAKMGALYVPDKYPIIRRHADLYRSVYLDHTNQKAQYYLFRPAGFHVWNETLIDEEWIPGCSYISYEYLAYEAYKYAGGTFENPYALWYWTIEDIERIFNYFYNSLMSSEDVASINGYIMACFGAEGLYNMTFMEDDPKPIDFEEDLDTLCQIHNATIYPKASHSYNTMHDNDITQDMSINRGWLIWKPQFEALNELEQDSRAIFYFCDRVMDSNSAAPTAQEVANNARFMCIPSDVIESVDSRKYRANVGTETIVGCTVWTRSPGSASEFSATSFEYANQTSSVATPAKISDFDFAPIFWTFSKNGGTLGTMGLFGELDNFTVMGESTLAKLREADVMYQWDITSQ